MTYKTKIRKPIEATEKLVPLTPSATSCGVGWNAVQAVHSLESRRTISGGLSSKIHTGGRWQHSAHKVLSGNALQKKKKVGADDANSSPVSFVTLTREIEDNIKELETQQKFVPYAPTATSYSLGWKGLQAVHFRKDSANEEFTVPPVSYHCVVLITRPPENWYVRYEGVERQTPPSVGSIAVVPAGSSLAGALAGE